MERQLVCASIVGKGYHGDKICLLGFIDEENFLLITLNKSIFSRKLFYWELPIYVSLEKKHICSGNTHKVQGFFMVNNPKLFDISKQYIAMANVNLNKLNITFPYNIETIVPSSRFNIIYALRSVKYAKTQNKYGKYTTCMTVSINSSYLIDVINQYTLQKSHLKHLENGILINVTIKHLCSRPIVECDRNSFCIVALSSDFNNVLKTSLLSNQRTEIIPISCMFYLCLNPYK